MLDNQNVYFIVQNPVHNSVRMGEHFTNIITSKFGHDSTRPRKIFESFDRVQNALHQQQRIGF